MHTTKPGLEHMSFVLESKGLITFSVDFLLLKINTFANKSKLSIEPSIENSPSLCVVKLKTDLL